MLSYLYCIKNSKRAKTNGEEELKFESNVVLKELLVFYSVLCDRLNVILPLSKLTIRSDFKYIILRW
ncbi:hypothetical protein DDW09_03870 [Sulfolobus sp. SCGC AB-777_L09]|nr:hypothetical protein DDW09_03870 [Sulfolobus sp. SCGC AB-777_L09]